MTALDIDTITAVMHVNYLSPVRLTMALLPQMLARGSGTIVNVSSIAAKLSAPGESAYDASKAALTAFSEAMAVDLWEDGIKVMVVYPGVIDTELFTLPDNDVPDLPVAAEPVSVAVDAILAGLEAGAAQVYVPEWFHGVVANKEKDVGAFLEGTAAYMRDQKQKQASRPRRRPLQRKAGCSNGHGHEGGARRRGHARGPPRAHHRALRAQLRRHRKDRRLPDHGGARRPRRLLTAPSG